MRALRIRLALLLVTVLCGVAFLVTRRPKPQVISLPDGSQLTLLKVTHGTNHVCRYQTGWQELLQPLLPKSLRPNLSPRELKFSTVEETVMVWFLQDKPPPNIGGTSRPSFFLAAVDENGVESELNQFPNATRTLTSGQKPPPIGAPATVTMRAPQVSGWNLRSFPRRSKEFRVQIYWRGDNDQLTSVGQFSVENPASKDFPVWSPESLPTTRQTNELEVTLARLESGLTGKEVGIGPAGPDARSFSRATLRFKENGTATQKWGVCGIRARSAAGDVSPGGSYVGRWSPEGYQFEFSGGLWLDEPAWQLNFDFARTEDFPTNELWTITSVQVPTQSEIVRTRTVTSRAGREFEFLGVSGPKFNLSDPYAGMRPHANVHLRTPHPVSDWRVVLVEVRDDRGQKAIQKGFSSSASTGRGGATPKQMLYGFAIEIPDGAKTLDITVAITPIRHAQFTAKPVVHVAR